MTISRNMRRYVSIEGPDGAGKSVVQQEIDQCLTAAGLKVKSVGKGAGWISETLTAALQGIGFRQATEFPAWSDLAEVLCRIARDFQRQFEVESLSGEVVLYDRFALSTLAYAAVLVPQQYERARDLCRSLLLDAAPHEIVFCAADFDVTQQRIQERRLDSSSVNRKEARGTAFNRAFGQALRDCLVDVQECANVSVLDCNGAIDQTRQRAHGWATSLCTRRPDL